MTRVRERHVPLLPFSCDDAHISKVCAGSHSHLCESKRATVSVHNTVNALDGIGTEIQQSSVSFNKEISTSSAAVGKRQMEADVNISGHGASASRMNTEQLSAMGTNISLTNQNSFNSSNPASSEQPHNGYVYASTLPRVTTAHTY